MKIPKQGQKNIFLQHFTSKAIDCHPNQWIDLSISNSKACTGIIHAAKISSNGLLHIRLVSWIIFLLPIIDFPKQKYGPLYFRRNTYVIMSWAQFSWDKNLNSLRAQFSIIDDALYLTSGANTTATRVVPYTESELGKKLTRNSVKIGIGSQCLTTFLAKEGINYLVSAFRKNDNTSDLHFLQTTDANKILKKLMLPGLVVRAELGQKNLTSYTAATKEQFYSVCGIFPST